MLYIRLNWSRFYTGVQDPDLPRGCRFRKTHVFTPLALQQSIDFPLDFNAIFIICLENLSKQEKTIYIDAFNRYQIMLVPTLPQQFSGHALTYLLAWKGPMLLNIMSRERGRSPPRPGEPVMVKVFPLPVTPYVNSRPTKNTEPTVILTQRLSRPLRLSLHVDKVKLKTGRGRKCCSCSEGESGKWPGLLWLTIFPMDEVINQRFGNTLEKLRLRYRHSEDFFEGILCLWGQRDGLQYSHLM